MTHVERMLLIHYLRLLALRLTMRDAGTVGEIDCALDNLESALFVEKEKRHDTRTD